MPSKKPVIIVHGGAGDWPRNLHESALSGVSEAAEIGFAALRRRKSSLDAVEAAVISLEDNPIFNAGTGSTLNLLGQVETDAGIMDGRTLRGGAVALLHNVRNPIRAARLVMDQTNHVLLAGPSAERLAIENGLPKANLRVQRRVRLWKEALRKSRSSLKHSKKTLETFSTRHFDTVGALAIDSQGNLAAADSTGGVSLKLPGRIGDSPILGAGLYANNRSGAATATGMGEQAMRLLISKTACDLMRFEPGPAVARKSILLSTETFGRGTGILTLDRFGRFGAAHNTRNLCWAIRSPSFGTERMLGTRV